MGHAAAPVPEYLAERLETLLAHHPHATDAQLARFADVSLRDFRLRMAADRKFHAVVSIKRALVQIAAANGLPARDAFDEPDVRAYSDIRLMFDDHDAGEESLS